MRLWAVFELALDLFTDSAVKPSCWGAQLLGNVILLRLGEQQWRDANLKKISTVMGHDCFIFRKLLCGPSGLVLEMQGYSDKFPLLVVENFF